MTQKARATEPVLDDAAEHDRAEQDRYVYPEAAEVTADLDAVASPPLEANEADAFEQHQVVPPDPDED